MSKIDEIKARHAKELADAQAHEEIMAQIPEDLRPHARIHVYNLYGTVASVKFEASIGVLLKWDFMADVAARFPAVATTMTKGTFRSFMPTVYVESLPEEKRKWTEESSVSPFRLDIERGEVTATWFARLPDGKLVTVSVVMGPSLGNVGVYTAKRVDYCGGYRYERATFRPGPQLHTVYTADGEPIAQLESPIVWASGGEQYPNRVTVYFVDLRAGADPAVTNASIADYVGRLALTC